MGITILGNVGKIIEDNHGEMYFDNAKKIVGTNENDQSNMDIQEAQVVEETQTPIPNEPKTQLTSDNTRAEVLELLFRPDDQDREKTQIILSGILRGKTTKTKAIRELYKYKSCFNIDQLTHEDKAKVITAWAEELGFMQHYKGGCFSDKDFGGAYNNG